MKNITDIINKNKQTAEDEPLTEGLGVIDKFINWLLGSEENEYNSDQIQRLKKEARRTQKEKEKLERELAVFKKELSALTSEADDALNKLEKSQSKKDLWPAKEALKVLCNRYIQCCLQSQTAHKEKDEIENYVRNNLQKYQISWTNQTEAADWLKKSYISNINLKA